MPRVGQRPLGTVVAALFQPAHYVALVNMLRLYATPLENLRRYLTGSGDYPYRCPVRTPLGMVAPTLFSHHDLLTANEVFCRLDYRALPDTEVVVDLGSNIGLSALYFLTRNRVARCYLFEPNPANTVKLRSNLGPFAGRYSLSETAVAGKGGRVLFGVEPTGRYGGIGIATGSTIYVDCQDINDVLSEVLRSESLIDILKIDTEGAETSIVSAIRSEFFGRIRRIYCEIHGGALAELAGFRQRRRGSVSCLTNIADPGRSS